MEEIFFFPEQLRKNLFPSSDFLKIVLENRTIHEREMAQKDQRNLYLLQEGFINEENRGSMNDRGIAFSKQWLWFE